MIPMLTPTGKEAIFFIMSLSFFIFEQKGSG